MNFAGFNERVVDEAPVHVSMRTGEHAVTHTAVASLMSLTGETEPGAGMRTFTIFMGDSGHLVPIIYAVIHTGIKTGTLTPALAEAMLAKDGGDEVQAAVREALAIISQVGR